MVYYHNSISLCKSLEQQPTFMANSMVLADPSSKSKQNNQLSKNKMMPNSPNCLKTPVCNRSRSAVIDIVIMIAVIGACGFLIFPYVKFITLESIEILGEILYLVGEEVSSDPLVYGSLGLSIFCAALAAWGVLAYTTRKCSNPNCKGHRKAVEFDIQLETEECVRNSNPNPLFKNGIKQGLFELPRDHHSELEMELKKMAPPNGRAVLVFRARCGCSIGRLEVPGPRKNRRIKK